MRSWTLTFVKVTNWMDAPLPSPGYSSSTFRREREGFVLCDPSFPVTSLCHIFPL